MKERTVQDLTGEIWAELHAAIDSRRDRGDHVLAQLDSAAVDAAVDLVTVVLTRNVGKTIVNSVDNPWAPLLSLYRDDRSRRRRLSARRQGVTLQ